jgi:RHH-type proline utilization regulon transcriptional repressor/proline dehydrogenase/delta 1-pyrroline-5-carboxylate dehydrogenase
LEALATDPDLAGWDGLGFVIQAYGKRCPFVIDFIVDLARQAGRRIMVRLVKGAYWDSEIKRAQVDGLADFPVFTRKVHTDVSFIACARKLLAAPDAVFPQFATHNCQTLATVLAMAGPDYAPDQYEFQCLHGMGEGLYEEVVGPDKLDRPCRSTRLSARTRRCSPIWCAASLRTVPIPPSCTALRTWQVPVEELIADPVAVARVMPIVGASHERIALPPALYGPERRNSRGLDLTDERELAALADALEESRRISWHAAPTRVGGQGSRKPRTPS